MPLPRWSDAQAREAQRLLTTTTLALTEISRRTGVPRRTLRDRVKGPGWTRPGVAPPMPPPGPTPEAGDVLSRSAAEWRLDILARALALAERHIAEAEELRAAPTADILAREREARFIGTVITLVQRHQQAEAAIGASAGADSRPGEHPGPAAEGDRSSDDARPAVPRSLDAVYRDFARRLDALLGADSGAALAAALGRAGPGALTGPTGRGGS
jgi:hypothetical protein